MAQDPWAQFRVQPAQAPQQAPREDIVLGRDPYKSEDQSFQRNAEARAQQDQVMQSAKFKQDQEKIAIEREKLKTENIKATEGQSKASGFLLRALRSNDTYEAQKIGARSYIGQKMADNAPDLLNSLPNVIGNNDQRQVADANQDDFIAATLRYESGAAIPPEELEAQRRRYFPMPGDDDAKLAAKTQLRKTAIDALKASAGDVGEKTYQEFLGEGDGLTGTVTDDREQDPAAATSSVGTPPSGGNPPAPNDGGGFMSQLGQGAMQGLGDIAEGAGDLVGLVGNPVNATINAATGSNLSTDLGRSLREALSLPENPNKVASAINQGAVTALGGAGAARGLASVANPGAWQNALATFGKTPVRDAVAGSAAGGASQFAEQSGAGPVAQVGAALAGGVAGYAGAGKVANRLAGERVPNALMSAADDLNVQMMPADVGGVGTRMATGAFGRTLGGIPIAEGAQKSINSAAAARSKVASDIGDATDNAGGGQAVKRGFDKFEKSSKDRADTLYGNISVPAESTVALANTRTALQEVTRGLKSNPELSKLWTNHPRLRATLEALTPTDTRQQGQIQITQASDKVKGAEDALARAKEGAARNLSFEQSQSRDAVEQAHASYNGAISQARSEMVQAQEAFDQLRNQVVAPNILASARRAADDAQIRFQAFAQKNKSVPEVAQALKGVDDAEAGFAAKRFSEPTGDEIAKAQDALIAAKQSYDEAFVASRQAPEGGELSWKDMNRFRSIVGEIIGQPGLSRDGSDIAGLRKLYGALTTDMEATASQAGPRALTEFRRATQYWRGREARIDDVFATLLGKDGKRSDEAVFKQINTWAQSQGGDFKRIAQTIRSMPEDEAGTIRATVVQRMGMAPSRRQDVTQEVFSPAEFAAQWNGMAPRAKSVLFPNQQHRQDLDKLAALMDGMRRADQYQNFSNTSLGVNMTAQGTLAYANFPAAAALALGQFGAGKLLASPRFARAIASTYKLPDNVAARRFSEQIKVIAAREPLIANDAKAVADYISKSLSQSPVRAAASEEEANGRREPPQQ